MPPGAAATARTNRRERVALIVEGTRALFDERGVPDAPMDEIARYVGVTKTLLYRYFESKEDLFFLTTVSYLVELQEEMAAADEPARPPVERLDVIGEGFIGFCLAHPAFLDCALELMRRPIGDLREVVSHGVFVRLGSAMAAPLALVIEVLEEGREDGVFAVEDAVLLAHVLFAQVLGALHVARLAAGVALGPDGETVVVELDPEAVRRVVLASAAATVRA